MDQDEIDLLDEYGWTVECESPLEISKTVDGVTSRATGEAARIVLRWCESQEGYDEYDEYI